VILDLIPIAELGSHAGLWYAGGVHMADAGYALVAHALCDAVTDRAFAT
jgi:hypothetical protein